MGKYAHGHYLCCWQHVFHIRKISRKKSCWFPYTSTRTQLRDVYSSNTALPLSLDIIRYQRFTYCGWTGVCRRVHLTTSSLVFGRLMRPQIPRGLHYWWTYHQQLPQSSRLFSRKSWWTLPWCESQVIRFFICRCNSCWGSRNCRFVKLVFSVHDFKNYRGVVSNRSRITIIYHKNLRQLRFVYPSFYDA